MPAFTQLPLFSSSSRPDAVASDDESQRVSDAPMIAAQKARFLEPAPPENAVTSMTNPVHHKSTMSLPRGKQLEEERYLSVRNVAERYDISIQTVWRHTKHNPDFPKPIKILNGSTRWRMSDILAFEVSRQEASR